MATDSSGGTDALLALYTTDREKLSTLAGERLALVAVQVTYLGLAIIALGGQRPIGGEWVAAFSAAPLWFMHAQHQILVAAALSRSRSVLLLERHVVDRAGLPANDRNDIGHRAAVTIRELTGRYRIFKLQIFIAFGGIAAALLSFTVYALVVAAASSSWTSLPVVLAILFYGGFATVATIGWTRTVQLQLDNGRLNERSD
ncbi:hypothetical protein [Glycomyces algeriensis]|uniref:Uncharacterized protein n=1 Tax=Glycomyces algeriensis TaxID=256037 RepID=A0A9W6GAC9_9ACTN|nr:hypothetical protein [Glycomyces algeriensis]MDA1364466.1 hypothetical protein [Glycomyces algeriensis]MDR7350499.1 hypothetical protein [Glycomyces algeriensis]GLI43207.1 hypothetical protein GALLR39Z86_30570 [Glycomyces algeriensis]